MTIDLFNTVIMIRALHGTVGNSTVGFVGANLTVTY